MVTAKGNTLWFPPPPEMPIYIGCQRKMLLRLAGEMCNGVIIDSATPEFADFAHDQLMKGAERVGRDLETEIQDGKFWFQAVVPMNISEDRDVAFERVRGSMPYTFQTMSEERRKLPDRRRTPTKPLSWHSMKGKRKESRRAHEHRHYYVDWYEPHYFITIVLILILCVMDAYLTLKILHLGGEELNPLMLLFFNKLPILSMVFKYVITAASIIVILIHKNFIVFKRVKVYHFIYAVFSVYVILVTYESYVLLSQFNV